MSKTDTGTSAPILHESNQFYRTACIQIIAPLYRGVDKLPSAGNRWPMDGPRVFCGTAEKELTLAYTQLNDDD